MTSLAEAAWYVDPLNRFDGRYFDGDQWTDQVSSNGLRQTDAKWRVPRQQPSQQDVTTEVYETPLDDGWAHNDTNPVDGAPESEPTNRRSSGERRQVNLSRENQPERRRGDRRMRAIVIPTAEHDG